MTSSRCPLCPGLDTDSCRIVSGTGPALCRYLFLGAGPGKREDAKGWAYAGLAGEELDHTYLSTAGMYRDEVHVSNAVRCWDGTDKTPSDKRVQACAHHHLPDVLARVRPEVVVLMGGATCRLSDTRIRLDVQHGIPFQGTVLGGMWSGWIWPMFEPALGMRETSRMTQLLTDFRHLGEWERGEWGPEIDRQEDTDYRLIETELELKSYLRLDRTYPYPYIAIDTESHGPNPWSVQFSHTPGTGRMVKAGNRKLLELLSWWIAETKVDSVFHFAGHDLDELDKLGVKVGEFRDTMQEAYHLCSLPQGLKALAFRLLGVRMRSWEDVVWPASVEAMEAWVRAAGAIAGVDYQTKVVTELKRGRCVRCGHQHSKGACKREGCGCTETETTNLKVEYKTGAVEAICKHILRYVGETREADEPYNPWEALARMKVEGLRGKVADLRQWEELEEQLGPVPILGIGNCDEAEAIRYGCGDSDLTGRIAVELERLRGADRWRIDEVDRDA